jgi:hypothetical protein
MRSFLPNSWLTYSNAKRMKRLKQIKPPPSGRGKITKVQFKDKSSLMLNTPLLLLHIMRCMCSDIRPEVVYQYVNDIVNVKSPINN